MFGLGFGEILVILVVALIVFGPDRLPEIARTLGRTMAEFRRAMDEMRYEFSASQMDRPTQPTSPQPVATQPVAPAAGAAPVVALPTTTADFASSEPTTGCGNPACECAKPADPAANDSTTHEAVQPVAATSEHPAGHHE